MQSTHLLYKKSDMKHRKFFFRENCQITFLETMYNKFKFIRKKLTTSLIYFNVLLALLLKVMNELNFRGNCLCTNKCKNHIIFTFCTHQKFYIGLIYKIHFAQCSVHHSAVEVHRSQLVHFIGAQPTHLPFHKYNHIFNYPCINFI